jgi:hypothetical protein
MASPRSNKEKAAARRCKKEVCRSAHPLCVDQPSPLQRRLVVIFGRKFDDAI